VKALAEMEAPISATLGASIGVLNGAVVASSASLADAAERLASGLPLYISVFPKHKKMLETVMGSGLAKLRIRENPRSEFIHVQALPPDDQHKALLASAAIPFLLAAQEYRWRTIR
jgi:predicted acylesterase/phospholipase RssA